MAVQIEVCLRHVVDLSLCSRLVLTFFESLHNDIVHAFHLNIISILGIAVAVEVIRVFSDIAEMYDVCDQSRTVCHV